MDQACAYSEVPILKVLISNVIARNIIPLFEFCGEQSEGSHVRQSNYLKEVYVSCFYAL